MPSRLAPLRFVVLFATLLSAACSQTQPYAALDEAAEPLRARFNADLGHVRVMMLVAPT